MLNQINSFSLHPFLANTYASIDFSSTEKIALCSISVPYIPIKAFQELFAQAASLVIEEKIEKFILDKRALQIFHQPSMEWYHVVWKEQMLAHGLRKYRKLLPEDTLFKQSVITGKNLIKNRYPAFDFTSYEILYCTSLQEAFRK